MHLHRRRPYRHLLFSLFSLWADCLLFCLTLAAVRRAGVRFELFHGAVLVAVYLLVAICFNLQVNSRSFIYVWDYSNYTLLQYQAEAAFQGGALAGLWHLVSTFTEDYTSFICLFTEFPFCLSAHTGDSYVLSQLISIFPTLLVALGGVVVKVGQLLPVRNDKGFSRSASAPPPASRCCGWPPPWASRLVRPDLRPHHPAADHRLPV